MLCHVRQYVSHDAREIQGLISGQDQRRACEQEQFHKAGYTATAVACGWAGAVIEVNASFGQEQ